MLKLLPDSIFQSCEVHEYCLDQSIRLLFEGNHPKLACMLKPFVPFMHQGSNWTDQGLRNLSHFYHPLEIKGLPGVHHAGDELHSVLGQMEKAQRQRNHPRYFFCLGIALHLIQDMCVPHHVFGCLLQGHHHYESWVTRNHRNYEASKTDNCDRSDLMEILEINALIAMNHEELLHQPTERQMQEATEILLPLAQQSGAAALLLLQDQISRLASHFETGDTTAVGLLKEA